jgi:hypothetical protein
VDANKLIFNFQQKLIEFIRLNCDVKKLLNSVEIKIVARSEVDELKKITYSFQQKM